MSSHIHDLHLKNMATYYCPRCGIKNISEVFLKSLTTPSSGTFIVGHIGDNPLLPMVAAPLQSGSSRLAFICKACGEEAQEILNEQEKVERQRRNSEINDEATRDNIKGCLLYLGFILAFFVLIWIGVQASK
jgi:transcription elongation factor Elf1